MLSFINYEVWLKALYILTIIYLVPITSLVLTYIYIKGYTIASLFRLGHNSLYWQYFIICFFLNLAGVPPLPGFFAKIYIYMLLLRWCDSLLLVFILIGLNFIIFYFYVKNIQFFEARSKKLIGAKPILYKLSLMLFFFYIYGSFLWPLLII